MKKAMKSRRITTVILAACCCLRIVGAQYPPDFYEGSGSYDDHDAEENNGIYDDLDYRDVIVPSRVIPDMQSPTGGRNEPVSMMRPEASVPPRLSSDPIYLDEGSGQDVDRTPLFEMSSATPQLPNPWSRPANSQNSAIMTQKTSDSPPILQRHLMKLAVTAGKSKRWRIPEDVFFDQEDGNTRNLRLSLRFLNGTIVPPEAWIRMDNVSQEIWIMPVDENDIGNWKFKILAQDKLGQSAEDMLEVAVRQFSKSRLVNHLFEIIFSFNDWKPSVVRNWEWKLIERIRQFFGDRNLDNIIVKSVSTRPFGLVWTNSSLIQQSCPKQEIQNLFGQMVDENMQPRQEFREAISNAVTIRTVRLKYLGTCLDEMRQSIVDIQDNTLPVIRNPIDRINVTAGELLRYKVPDDTCYDREDGSTTSLSLHLLTMNKRELSPKSWLQFNPREQKFLGVPLEEEVGREEYQLVCSDRDGLSVIDGIEIIVYPRPFTERFAVEFAFDFADDIDLAANRVRLVETLASFFRDASSENIVVKSVSDGRFEWFNVTMSANDGCHPDKVNWIHDQLKNAKGELDARLVQHFLSQNFHLQNTSVILRGSCAFTTPFPEVDEPSHNNIFHGIIPSSEYLMTFLIPAVIISFMLLLALILACFLHRKRKAGKLNLFYSEALPPRVPVILQDELFDENDPSSYPRHPQADHPEEVDRLIQGTRIVLQQADVTTRPTPTYQRRS